MTDVMQNKSHAVLAQLQISQWSANKMDKNATAQLLAQTGAKRGAARVHKSLLPFMDALDNIHKMTTIIRTNYYKNTMEWGINGTQLLATANYLQYSQQFATEKNTWKRLVRKFLDQYVNETSKAAMGLGSLHNLDDYPSPEEVAKKFDIDLVIMPLPDINFVVDVNDQALAEMRAEVEQRVKTHMEHAMTDLWKRVYEKISHMSEKLNDPSAIFRDSMVEHTLELCEMVPRMNFTGDEELNQIARKIKRDIARVNPDTLRHDLDLRREKGEEAKEIMAKMAAFMGVE